MSVIVSSGSASCDRLRRRRVGARLFGRLASQGLLPATPGYRILALQAVIPLHVELQNRVAFLTPINTCNVQNV